jgi:hypothetical protein
LYISKGDSGGFGNTILSFNVLPDFLFLIDYFLLIISY